MASNVLTATDKGDYIEVEVPWDHPLIDKDIREWSGIARSLSLVDDGYEVRERRQSADGAVLIFKPVVRLTGSSEKNRSRPAPNPSR